MSFFLGMLAAFYAHLIRLNPQDFGHADAQHFRLNDCGNKAGHFRQTKSFSHITQCVPAKFSKLDFPDDPAKSHGQFVIPLFIHLGHGGIKTQAGLHANGQQIQSIRHCLADLFLPAINLAADPQIREEITKDDKSQNDQKLDGEGKCLREQGDEEYEATKQCRRK